MTQALRHGTFRKLVALYSVNLVVEWFGSIALMVVVYGATKSASIAAAMLICKQVAPGAIVPMLSSAIDRMQVRRALALALVVQAGAFAGIALLGWGVAVFPLSLLAGTAGAVARAGLRSTVVRTLPAGELRGGNAVLNVVMGIAAPLGPGLAAYLVSTVGAAGVLGASAVALVLLGLAAFSLPAPAGRAEAPEVEGEAPLAVGVRRAAPGAAVPLSWLFVLVGLVTAIYSLDQPALLAFAEDELHAGVAGYGAIFTAWGVGVAIGSAVFPRLLAWPMLRVYALGTSMSGLAYLGMAVSPTIGVACAIAVFGGVGSGLDWVAIVTAIQEAAPVGEETQVATRLEAIAMAAPGVGILLGGVIADLGSPRLTILVSGALALAVLALGLIAVRLRVARLGGRRPSVLSPSIPGGSA